MADYCDIKDYGLVLGSFSPMHTGHLDLIMMAKKACRKGAIVSVCGLDGDRGTRVGLPLERRYEIVSEIFRDDPLVKVVCMKDNDIGIAGYNDKWKEWLTALAKKIAKELTDDVSWQDLLANLTLFTGEQSYLEAVESAPVGYRETHGHIEELGPNAYLVPRTVNPISATLIRKRPMTFWNEIVGPYRYAFAKRILVIGTASEGKSTLTRDLATYFDADFSVEYGHEVIAERTRDDLKPDDTKLSYPDFLEFLNRQYEMNVYCNKKLKICDSDAMTTLMYAKYYSEDPRYALSKKDYLKLEEHARFLKYDLIFILPPKEKSWVQDGSRDCLTNSFEDRKNMYQVLMKIIGQHYCTEDVVYLTGTYYQNFITAKDRIRQLMED